MFTCCGVDARNSRTVRWVVDDLGCRTTSEEPGNCVLVGLCRDISNLVADMERGSEEYKQTLREHACGVDKNGDLKVCCMYDQVGKPAKVDITG